MKQFLMRMFSDKSDVNSKAVVGFMSFIAMLVYGMTDVVTGAIGKEFIVEKELFENKDNNHNEIEKKIFMKIDIEGSEYRILDDIIKFEDHIKGIVIEFHQVDLNIERINDFIKKTNLKLIHTHPNNFANYGLNNIPTSLEISFSKEPEKISNNLEFPHLLDQKNNPNISDINLEFESEIYKC